MIYLDNAATTKMDEDILELMKRYFTEDYYNPSSLYFQGQKIKTEIDKSRERVSELLGCEKSEIIFTASGTESDNMAVKGVSLALKAKGRHLITSEIEHHGVLNSFKWLENFGFEVTYLPVDKNFMVKVEDFEKAIRRDTIFASIMMVNNEVGAIQPIKKLVEAAKRNQIVFHTDAVQALGTEKIEVKKLGIDLLTISGHKIYGPKGIGGLYIKKGTPLFPLISGGQQEQFIRPGTESVPQIIGFGMACEKLIKEKATRKAQVKTLKAEFLKEILKSEQSIQVHAEKNSVDSILSLSVKDSGAEMLLMLLAQKGILGSMGSACNSEILEPSHVIRAGRVGKDYENGTLRFSFGKHNTKEEVKTAAKELRKMIKRLKEF